MATDFSENTGDRLSIPFNERKHFYAKMHQVAVEINVISPNRQWICSGVIIEGGLVLTSLVGCITMSGMIKGTTFKFGIGTTDVYEDEAIINVIRCGETYVNAKIVAADPKYDCLLLSVDAFRTGRYTLLGFDQNVTIGMEVHTISTPIGLESSFTTGQIGHTSNPAITPRDFYHSYKLDNSKKSYAPTMISFLLAMKENCWLNQVNNNHGMRQCLGSPVFDSYGMVVGLICLLSDECDYMNMASSLHEFIGNYKRGTYSYMSSKDYSEAIHHMPKLFKKETGGDAGTSVAGPEEHFYNTDLNYYHDPRTGLYFSPNSQKWFTFNQETKGYEEYHLG